MHVNGQAKHVKHDFFDEHNVHGHTKINRIRKLTKMLIISLAYKMLSRNFNVKQRRILLTFSSVIENYHGESITLMSVGFASRYWNHSCVFMVPYIDVFDAIITSLSKKEDFKCVYCCLI